MVRMCENLGEHVRSGPDYAKKTSQQSFVAVAVRLSCLVVLRSRRCNARQGKAFLLHPTRTYALAEVLPSLALTCFAF